MIWMAAKFAAMLMIGVAAWAVGEIVFHESDGIVVIEAEMNSVSTFLPQHWNLDRIHAGYSGRGYVYWSKPEAKAAPPGTDIRTYYIQISNPATYELRMRCRQRAAGGGVWLRWDRGQWISISSEQTNQWTWDTQPRPRIQLSKGVHTLEVGARSRGFILDRLHLFREGVDGALDHTRPQSHVGPVDSR